MLAGRNDVVRHFSVYVLSNYTAAGYCNVGEKWPKQSWAGSILTLLLNIEYADLMQNV